MAETYTYETTYENERENIDGAAVGTLEVRFIYTVIWGCEARINYNEHDHPAEASEVEIVNIHIEVDTINGGRRWFDAIPEDHDMLLAWAETDLFEEMLEEAADTEKDREAEALERRDEERREREWL